MKNTKNSPAAGPGEPHDLAARVRRELWHHHPSAFLLAAQVLLLILYAIFDGARSQQAVIGAFGVLVLMLAVWVIMRSSSIRWITWSLAVPAVILSLASVVLFNPLVVIVASLVEGILYFYAAGSLIGYMMDDDRVTADELFAAGSTFTLLAWGFAYIYLAIQAWVPGSFISTVVSGRALGLVEMLSLSFSNLTATGLSDILAGTTAARVVIMLEQFAGVGYIAIVVSRLVGLTIQRRERKSKSG